MWNKWKKLYLDLEVKYAVLTRRYSELNMDYEDLIIQYNQLRHEFNERDKVRFDTPIPGYSFGESTTSASDRESDHYKSQMVGTVQTGDKIKHASSYTVKFAGIPITGSVANDWTIW